jgi:hypothetical protein
MSPKFIPDTQHRRGIPRALGEFRYFQMTVYPGGMLAIAVFLHAFLRALRSSALQFADDGGRKDSNAED